MGIGTRLDALIRAKGTRPGTLAREAGVSKNTVYSIIKRNNDKVDPDILARLTDEKEREVLELRYLSGYDFQVIADRMFLSERTVRRIHVKALENIQR